MSQKLIEQNEGNRDQNGVEKKTYQIQEAVDQVDSQKNDQEDHEQKNKSEAQEESVEKPQLTDNLNINETLHQDKSNEISKNEQENKMPQNTQNQSNNKEDELLINHIKQPEEEQRIHDKSLSEDNQKEQIEAEIKNDKSKDQLQEEQNESSKKIQQKNIKSNVIQYEKNGITFEIERPTKIKIQLDFLTNTAPNMIAQTQGKSVQQFYEKLLKKAQKIGVEDSVDNIPNKSNIYVATIKPQKRPKQQVLDQSQGSEKQKPKPQQKRVIKSLAPPKQLIKRPVEKTAKNQDDTTQEIVGTSEKKKRELQNKLEEIRKEILEIELKEQEAQNLALKQNKSSVIIKGSPAKLNVVTKNEQPTSVSQDLNIKKHNQVAVMIKISDDKNKLKEALGFVRKLNKERKEREKKFDARFQIDVQRQSNGHNQVIIKLKNNSIVDTPNPSEKYQLFQQKVMNEIQQITNEQRLLSNQLQGERQMKIMERITLREKTKYDLIMRQERTKQFLKEIKKNASENGVISKKFMHELEDLDLGRDVDVREEHLNQLERQIPGSLIIEKDFVSGVMSRVIADDKKKKVEEKIKNFQKQEMYRKRQAYGEHVNRNFLPKIQRSLNREDLLDQYRQLAEEYKDDEYQPQHKDSEAGYQYAQQGNYEMLIEEAENYEYKIKNLSKKRAWQINHELFEKPLVDKYRIKE